MLRRQITDEQAMTAIHRLLSTKGRVTADTAADIADLVYMTGRDIEDTFEPDTVEL